MGLFFNGFDMKKPVILTEQHAAVAQQVAEVLEHGSLVDPTRAAEVAEEAAARHHHVGRRVLKQKHGSDDKSRSG